MKANYAFIISVCRGVIISGALIVVLPMIFAPSAIWMAMPITEAVVFIFAVVSIKLSSKKISYSLVD